jgi:purine-nucleoside phosphorylase
VTSHRGLLGYTGTVDGIPVSVQTTMMGTPTTTIVVEELLMLGVTTFIRVGTTGGFGRLGIGDVCRVGGGVGIRDAPPGARADGAHRRLRRRACARAGEPRGSVTHVGRSSPRRLCDPHPTGGALGRRGYLSAEMETAAVYLSPRERAKAGRPGGRSSRCRT